MFRRCMLPNLALGTLPGHAGMATSALGTGGSAVAAHARGSEARAIVVSGLQVAVVVVIAIGRCHTGAVHPRVGILDSVVSANQAMVSVVATVGQLLTRILVLVPAAVWTEVPVRVIATV